MEIKDFIIELIKYASWPLVAAFTIYSLRDKVNSLFGGGVKSAKHGGTELQFFENKQATVANKSTPQDLKKFIPKDPTGLREGFEEYIHSQLAQITGEKEQIDVLVKNLAQQQIANSFDEVYYEIFGSQIRLLEFLSVQPEGASKSDILAKQFDLTKETYPDVYGDAPLSEYMNFLVSTNLVHRSENTWTITKDGSAFITYITAKQLTKNKLY